MPSAGHASGHPFQPRSLPPAPPAVQLGFGDSIKRALGSAKAAAKKNFLEACRLFNTGSFAAADALFAQVAINQLPDPHVLQVRATFYRAFCAAFAGDYATALSWTEFVCNNQPDNEPAFALLGRLQYVLGYHEAAVSALQHAGSAPEVQSALAAAQREHVADLLRAGRLDEAWPWLQQRSSALSVWRGQIRFARACQHYRAAHYGTAIGECDAAHQDGYDSPALNSLRGLAHLALLYPSAARLDFRQACEHLAAARRDLPARFAAYPDQLDAGLERMAYTAGTARLMVKDYAAAIDLLNGVSASPFAPPQTSVLLALARHWGGDTASACQVLKSAPPEAQQLLEAQYLAGYLARRLGRTEDAYRYLQPLYQGHPDFPGACQELAGASFALGVSTVRTDPIQAAAMLRFARSVKCSPLTDQAYAGALCIVGAHALVNGQYVEAVNRLTEAAAIENAPSSTRVYLGLAYLGQSSESARAGDVAEAVRHIQECLDTWLGHGRNTGEAWDHLLQNGLPQAVPADIRAEWVARVLTLYAAFLLRQAATDPESTLTLLQRAQDYLKLAVSVTPAPAQAHFLRGSLAYMVDHNLSAAVDEWSVAHTAGLNTPGMLRMLAAALFDLKEYARAISIYRALLDDPTWGNSPIAFYLAYCLWKTGQSSQAADVLAPFIHQPGVALPIVLFYSYLMYASGQVEQSAVLLEPLRAQSPEEPILVRMWPVIAYEASVALARAGKLDEAAARLEQLGSFPNVAQASRRAQAIVEQCRVIEALRHNQFDVALESAEASVKLDEARQATLMVLVSLARFGQAVTRLNQGNPRSALSALDEAETGLRQTQPDVNAPWSVYVTCVRAAILLSNADTLAQASELLEKAHAGTPTFAPSAALCGLYRWHIKHDVAGAITAWQAGLPSASSAPVLWRLLGMAYMQAACYAEAAEAFASYRTAVGDAFPQALNYQAFCLLMSDRPDEVKALFPTSGQLDAYQSYLRGYARFRSGAWSGAYKDFVFAKQRGSIPHAPFGAALAACQVAKVLIASGDLAGADRLLSEALQVGGAEIRPAIEQAQAHLRRQQGVTLLKQGKLKEAADLLSAATEQGLTDNVTRGALAVARFGLARARGAVQEMQAAADVLKHTLPPALAARVLIEIGCQQLRAASTMAAQQRGAAASQLRASLNPLLEQAANSFCEALRLDDAQHAVHYVLGRLAFYLLRNLKLALLHLAKAEALVAKIGLTDSTLGDVYLEVGQVFTAKRFFYMRWQSKQDADRALQSLRQVLSREAGLLRRFARDEAVPEEPSVVEESADIIERIQVLNHLAERLMINLPSDQQKQIRSLCSKLKMALVDRDSSKLEKLEQDLLAQLGPALVK